MIVEFSVGNYKSFKEVITFSMLATKTRAKDEELDKSNVFQVGNISLLKSAAIYGANGSGKSNFIKALRFMRWFVLNSSKGTQTGDSIDVEQFRLSEQTLGEPSLFEMIFISDDRRFRYGFEVDKERVVSEWLFHVPRKSELTLFIREGDNITVSRTFKEGKNIVDITRPNTLFLSVVAQFNGSLSKTILQWFRRLRVYAGGLQDMPNSRYTKNLIESSKYRDDVLQIMKVLGLDPIDFVIAKQPVSIPRLPFEDSLDTFPEELKDIARNLLTVREKWQTALLEAQETKIFISRPRYDTQGLVTSFENFDIETQESAGTQKIFRLAGSLVDVLKNGKIFIIDELDVRLHPLITCAIIKLFNSNITNSKNAQLVFTTHDTNLLDHDIFRRDQIWFTEKDAQGASYMHSLVEYKIRNDAAFEKNYIQGRYGAIPFIGNLKQLAEGSPNNGEE